MAARKSGFTLVEALLAVALLGLALVPLLQTAQSLLAAAGRAEAHAAAGEIALDRAGRAGRALLSGAREETALTGYGPDGSGGRLRLSTSVTRQARAGRVEHWSVRVAVTGPDGGARAGASRDLLLPLADAPVRPPASGRAAEKEP
jgi:type II secretory pathway pseudopilin PulG